MVVGMITISNTFSILLAGRRRQIGLLRAVGASGNKIRISVFLESLLLSVIGVGAGILLGYLATLVGAGILGMLGVGVSLPVNDALVSGLLGIVITLIAAFVPTLKATRVSPLEALRQSTAQDEKRVGIVRAILCGILVILGGATIALGLQAGSFALLAAVAGSALLAIGILFGAPLFVPVLLKGIVAVISRFGPLPRLAAKNVIRSPRRSAATATALMLAIGLIVTMQVATATLRENFLSQIVNRYPIDVSVTTLPEGNAAIPADTQNQLLAVDGVGAAVTLMGAVLPAPDGDDSNSSVLALAFDAAIFDVVKLSPYALPDDSVFVSPQLAQSAPTIKFGSLELRTIGVPFAGNATYIINRLNLERIVAAAGSDKYDIQARAMWFSVPDRSMATSVYVDVNRITQGQTGLLVGGSIADAAGVEGMLFMLMAVVTALLGVAVLIALVGVSNTLTLSVMERKRESALMRALGLQKSSLRLMLFFEALLLSGVGAIVGIAAGVFFGWIGVVALNATMGLAGSALSVDIVWTVVLLVAAIAVAGLASLIPGRRAANAPPVAALADL
jgi:putative ABC transport system permease protein